MTIIEGGIHLDRRGYIKFINEFGGVTIQRLYIVQNHKRGQIRAWHGHKREEKRVICLRGVILIGIVQIDDWLTPNPHLQPITWTLSGDMPKVLYIPHGYANGWMNLTEDAEVMFLSSRTLDQSLRDDFRFPFDYWNIWEDVNE